MPPERRRDDPEPIAVETTVRRFDDAVFVDLVAGLWERRGWTVESRTPDGRCVDLLLRKERPENRIGPVRVVRPSTERREAVSTSST